MLRPERTRLEVWGDPVAHSRSPQLHRAACATLGLRWTYDRRQVSESAFLAELAGLPAEWRGLSLTYPLKSRAFEAAAWHDRRAELTGAVNTLLLTEDGLRGFNTDIGGIVRALQEEGAAPVPHARIVGAGATATSALVALSELGANRVEIVARREAAVTPLVELGSRLGVDVVGVAFDDASRIDVPVTVAALPGDAAVPAGAADALARRGGLLLDAVYGHWPTSLAEAWARAGNPARSGLGMLLHQAVLQVRIFVHGDPDVALHDEAAVLADMRAAVVGD